MQEGALAFIWSPGLHLWSSTSRRSWSPEQRRSAGRAPTGAPPRRELPVGPAGSPEWKPSPRSGKAPKKIQIRQMLHWQPTGPAGCNLREGDAAALTWSLIPVAMWPTFTRRVSLMWMLRQLKSRMQTSTPGANQRQRYMRFNWQVLCHATAGQLEPRYTVFAYEQKLDFMCLQVPSKQQGGGSWEWLSRSTLNTWTSGWLLDE